MRSNGSMMSTSFTSEDVDITQRAIKADSGLFSAICSNPHHVLYTFLPELKNTGHNTRKRVHNFVLPLKDDSNFIPRMLYSNAIKFIMLSSLVGLSFGSWTRLWRLSIF